MQGYGDGAHPRGEECVLLAAGLCARTIASRLHSARRVFQRPKDSGATCTRFKHKSCSIVAMLCAAIWLTGTATAAPINLWQGMKMIAMPGALPASVERCFDLLEALGGETVIAQISRVDGSTHRLHSCGYTNS
jgi:hypothetical protein